MKSSSSTQRGFTLVELMVTVVIIAILSAVAVAAFQGYKRSAKRSEGIALINDIRGKQEMFFQSYSRYVSSTVDEDVFDGTKMIGENVGYYEWDEDCTAAGNPWCMIGFRPQGHQVAGVNALLFQLQTIAWEPAATPPSFITGEALDTHWWSVQARGLPTESGKFCTLLTMTNASREVIVNNEWTTCP